MYESGVKYPPHAKLLRPLEHSKENNSYIRIDGIILSENASYTIDGRSWKLMLYDKEKNEFKEHYSIRADPVSKKILSAPGQRWIVIQTSVQGMICTSNVKTGVTGPWSQDLYVGGEHYYETLT